MLRSIALLTASALVAAACTQPEEKAQPPAPAQPAPQSAQPMAPPVSYACESGESVTVQYPDTATAQITYRTQTFVLRLTPAATGVRYAGSGLEWWTANTDGQESATLSRLGPNEEVGVAVLERCSRPSSGPVPTGPSPALPPTQPIPGQSPTGGLTPTAAPCRSAQLRLSSEGGDAGAGNRVMVVGVQNIGTAPCSVTGWPTVTLQDVRGRNLTAVQSQQELGSYFRQGQTPRPVTIPPQGKAYFDIAWSVMPNEAIGQTTCPSAARIKVTPPGDAIALNLDQTFTPCGGRIRISPFRAMGGPSVGNPASA